MRRLIFIEQPSEEDHHYSNDPLEPGQHASCKKTERVLGSKCNGSAKELNVGTETGTPFAAFGVALTHTAVAVVRTGRQ